MAKGKGVVKGSSVNEAVEKKKEKTALVKGIEE